VKAPSGAAELGMDNRRRNNCNKRLETIVIRIGRLTRRSAGRCRVESLDIGTSARRTLLFGTMRLYPTLD
jgi:hypothetical protein